MTRRNVERVWEHIDGHGAKWTAKYPPVEGKEILYMQDNLKLADENRITLEMMAKYGVRNVRGGDWCKLKMTRNEIRDLEKKIKTSKSKSRGPAKKKSDSRGFCIRCSKRQRKNIAKPLCGECYDIWIFYANSDYQEKCCNYCGKKSRTTIDRPLCRSCWTARQ